MKLKVCGMRDPENIRALLEVSPDYMGFIFYEKSKRYVGPDFELPDELTDERNAPLPQRVGVFVNHDQEYVLEQVHHYTLQLVQLHGDESPAFCHDLRAELDYEYAGESDSVKIIKAFPVNTAFGFQTLEPYQPYCDFFLFDAKTPQYGGSGQAFDWEILKAYPLATPIFISGGIGPDNFQDLLQFIRENQLNVHAIDINSRFETAPGLKDIQAVAKVREALFLHL
ncbi:MAG: phosphoribosylanthranilate isomerase [Bacteroidia bacterium]|nr:phosphoribosylanthranilate isomerase [Bacteroidia bacterium]